MLFSLTRLYIIYFQFTRLSHENIIVLSIYLKSFILSTIFELENFFKIDAVPVTTNVFVASK